MQKLPKKYFLNFLTNFYLLFTYNKDYGSKNKKIKKITKTIKESQIKGQLDYIIRRY